MLAKRLIDKITGLSLMAIMKAIAIFLDGKTHKYKTNDTKDYISVYISKLFDIKFITDYFNKYPLQGIKF